MEIKKSRFIEIKIPKIKGNKNRFTDVALFVDNVAFLEEVKKLREKYKIHKLYTPKNTYQFTVDLHSEGLYEQFNSDIENLRKRFGKSLNFTRVIKRAIINGVIEDEDYSTAYLEEQEIYPFPGKNLMEIKYSITVFPYTSLEDVEKVFKQFRKLVKLHIKADQKQEAELVSKYEFIAGFKNYPRFDTKSSIFRIRDWYIRSENGEKPLGIALKDHNLIYDEYRKIYKIYKNGERARGKDITMEMFNSYGELLEKIDRYKDNVRIEVDRHRELLMQS